MIIESIQLKNFISHENTSISFPLGVSIIVGPNGAGKSAIMDAIYYALLGDKVRGDSVDDLIRRGTNQASVLLTFKAGDTTYTIERTRFKKKNPSATIKKENNPLATTKAQVNAVVSEILGMDKNSIENSIFIRQGEITSLLDADPAERKEIIGKLIGLDKLEKSFTNMRDVIRHFEDKLSTYEVINTEIKTRQEVVKKLTKEINEIEQNINKTKQQLAKSKSKLKSMEKEFKEMEDKKSNHDKIASEIAILTERMKMKKENLNDLLEQQDKAEKAKKKCQKIEPEIKNIDVLDNYIKLIKDKKELEKRIVNLNKEFKRVQEYHDQLKEKEDAHVKYLENEKKQDSLKDEYEKIKDAKVKHAKVEETVKKLTEQEGELNSEIERLRKKALKLLKDATKEEWTKEINKIKEEIKNLEKLTSDLENEIGEIKGRLREIDEYVTLLEDKEECPVCSSKLSESHRKEVIDNFSNEKIEMKEKLEKNTKKITNLNNQKEKLRKKLEQLNKLNIDDLIKKQEKLQSVIDELSKNSKRLKELNETVKKVDDLEKEMKNLENLLKNLKVDHTEYLSAKNALEKERALNEIKKELEQEKDSLIDIELQVSKIKEIFDEFPENPKEELKRLQNLKSDYDGLKPEAERLDTIKEDVKALKSKIKELEKNIDGLKEKISNLGYDAEIHANLKKDLEKLQKNISAIEKDIEINTKNLKNKKSDKTKENDKIKELKEKLKKLEKVKNLISLLREIRQSFAKDGIQKFLRKRISPLITEKLQEYLDYFNLNISSITIDENFDLSFFSSAGNIPIKSMSGGEKVAIAIALRLAIAHVLSGKVSTIIMDEPTTHLDEERRRELVRILNTFLREKSTVPQMIIVTHHQELEDLADNIYQVRKEKNVSIVVEKY